jgi:hypothetical protein
MRLRLAFCALCAALPAAADEFLPFQSPSGNIHCMLTTGFFDGARCDIFDKTPSLPPPPGGCPLDWGTAFEIGASGRGGGLCAGDTVAQPNSVVLPYGAAISFGGVTCWSERTGMTCTNGEGGGFSLSRQAQRVF